ncbi:MAG: acyl-CoA dehydrogenase family protein [Acidimicrobiia bacterium]|nr:acyl-CoA dehydrogenase family protein [Acidimicrobiia bacterium]
MAEPTPETVAEEVRAWLKENWDPDLTVREWWLRLARSGYATPTFPDDSFGRGYDRGLAKVVAGEMAAAGAIGPPAGLGFLLAAPTLVAHGTREQKDHFLWRIITGEDAWCQLFSEPGAGSDLASLQCRAERDGDEWVITGQKVWTSTAQLSNLGMLLARTDPDVPKHAGISYFAFDMTQPGVEVRPLREMTGRAMFNEVFIDGARVPDANLIGGLNNGWAVANTTLAAERAGLGGGGSGATGGAFPGEMAGQLTQRVGDLAGAGKEGIGPEASGDLASSIIRLARDARRTGDPAVRQSLARLHSLNQIAGYSAMRARAGRGAAGAPNLAKLLMSEILRTHRDAATLILGPDAMLLGPESASGGLVQEQILFSPGPSIYGGSDQIQKNIVGERVLGLPREPDPYKGLPFREIPRNT